jgi:hypothetical protein
MRVILVFKKIKGEINFIGAYSSTDKIDEYVVWSPALIGDGEFAERGIALAKRGYYIYDDIEIDKKYHKMVIK